MVTLTNMFNFTADFDTSVICSKLKQTYNILTIQLQFAFWTQFKRRTTREISSDKF